MQQRPAGPGCPRVLLRVQVGQAGQGRHLLVQPRVVLHGAAAQGVHAALDVVVQVRQGREMAHDLRLAERGQIGRRGAAQARRQVGRHRGAVPGGEGQAAAAGAALVEERGGQVGVPAAAAASSSVAHRYGLLAGGEVRQDLAVVLDLGRGALLGDGDQQVALAAAGHAVQGDAGQHAALAGEGRKARAGLGRRSTNSLKTGPPKGRLTPVTRRHALAQGRAADQVGLAQFAAARRRRAWPGRRWRAGRSGPGWCRCCWWPSRAGCAARGSAGSARSRRCPRVSRVRPTTRPGMRRLCSSLQARKPSSGPPQPGLMPKGWASPTASSAPYSAGALSTDRETGLTAAITAAPPAWPRPPARRPVRPGPGSWGSGSRSADAAVGQPRPARPGRWCRPASAGASTMVMPSPRSMVPTTRR